MQSVNDFFNHPFFVILGGIATLFSLLALGFTVYLWARGILPVWWRLGIGLSTRKIAIFADKEFDNLKDVLVDSKLFRESNIVRIDTESIKRAEGCPLLLVHWKAFENQIDDILHIKRDFDALVIYAPHKDGPVPPEATEKINRHRNAILVNMRGRLLNDILTCMMTTGFVRG